MHPVVLISLVLLGVVALIEIVARAVATTISIPIFERRPALNARSDDPVDHAEPITLRTVDGVRIAASLIPRRDESRPARGLVVFLPEFGGSRWSANYYAAGPLEAGYDVLAFDFRNHGDSEHVDGYEPSHWVGIAEIRDADAAIDEALRRAEPCGLPVVLLGISRGASTSLISTARHRDVAAVVAECPPSVDPMMLHYAVKWAELYVPKWFARAIPEWHMAQTMRIVRHVASWRRGSRIVPVERSLRHIGPRPCLMISGQKDTYIPGELIETMCGLVGPSCERWDVPRARHNLARLVGEAEYDRRIVAFCDQVGLPDEEPVTIPIEAAVRV
ncbi:MAG: alpha/beta fold hydrolase [Planctomycetota bacterium]